MSEYGSDYNDDAFEEKDEEKDGDMSEEKILDKDEEIYNQFEDPFEEYNNFDPQEEVEEPFEEYNNFDPQEEVEEPFEEHKNLVLDNFNEGSKDYNNLLKERIQNTFRQYYDETGKYANYGRNLRKDFIEWVENTEKNPEIINRIKDIQNNQEISNFIKDKVQNTIESQSKIIKLTEDIGIHVSHGTIKTVSLEHVYNNDLAKYEERFLSHKYKGVSGEKRDLIEQRLRLEVKKENPDSLYKISEEFLDVSTTTINKIAKECINPEIFEKTWPPSMTEIPDEIKEQILKTLEKEIQKEKLLSLKKISDIFNVSDVYIQNIAKELYPDQYSVKWPAIQKIPLKIKQQIINTIKEETQKERPRTLKEIHERFPSVSSATIKQLAKKVVPKEIREKIWLPICKKIPYKIRIQIEDCLKNEILKANPRSFDKIAEDFKASREYIRKTAIRIIPQSIYRKIWEPSLVELTEDKKKEIMDCIQKTRLNLHDIAKKCGVHRKTISKISQIHVFKDNINAHQIRFSKDLDCEIGTFTHKNINSIVTVAVSNISNSRYYSEPKIFPDLRSSDGIILEYNNFLKQRLTNPKNGKKLVKRLGISPKDIKKIKATQFDFSNDISDENVINKIEKYQSPGTLLFIVGTKWDYYNKIKELPNNDIIKYPENIKIIRHDLFADLIGISGKDREIFNNIIALNNNKDLVALKALYNYDLSSVNINNTNHFKEELIQKKLIKEDFNEYFKFENLKSEDKIEKQLELDYFINI